MNTITVEELIEHLKRCDPHAGVCFSKAKHYFTIPRHIPKEYDDFPIEKVIPSQSMCNTVRLRYEG